MERNKTETKISLQVPSDITSSEKLDIALKVLQFIHDRTVEGKNVYNRPWSGKAGKYTDSYAKKKGKSSPVDLTDTREMLGKMQYFPSLSKSGEIVLGFKDGTKVRGKAEGNIQGTYGGNGDGSRARPFLDILKKDLNSIIKEVQDGDDS